jgi:hypothetical protein
MARFGDVRHTACGSFSCDMPGGSLSGARGLAPASAALSSDQGGECWRISMEGMRK